MQYSGGLVCLLIFLLCFCFQVQEHHIKINYAPEDEGMFYQRSYSIHFRVGINLKFDSCSSDELPCSKFQLNPYGAPDLFVDLGGVLHSYVYAYNLKRK